MDDPPPLPLRKKQFPTSGGNKARGSVFDIEKKNPAEISTKEVHLDTISVKLSPEYSQILKVFQVHYIAVIF